MFLGKAKWLRRTQCWWMNQQQQQQLWWWKTTTAPTKHTETEITQHRSTSVEKRQKIRETEIIENYKWIRREFVYKCLPSLRNTEAEKKKNEWKNKCFFSRPKYFPSACQPALAHTQILMCHKRWFHHLLSTLLYVLYRYRIVSFAHVNDCPFFIRRARTIHRLYTNCTRCLTFQHSFETARIFLPIWVESYFWPCAHYLRTPTHFPAYPHLQVQHSHALSHSQWKPVCADHTTQSSEASMSHFR